MQKHRISTDIGKDQKVTIELKQDYDLLEILSLKFTQQEAYTSLCSDYGVVCGRVTANNGLGIPNVKVSVFVPQKGADSTDPVISALYPYTSVGDKNDDGYRYNLLPSRKQHGGHVPTGTFFDQEDILSREEVLEVYETYYNYTVKTNSAGDFMIWGVPLGEQTIHAEVDLSDMGCFSIRPYDFIRQGVDEKKFDRFYNFKSDEDIDGLEQIVSFNKKIEVFPFWGNQDLCEIGISRVDFDLSDKGVKVEPISLVLISSVTDNNSDAVKKTGVIRMNTGYKCNLQTSPGKIEGVRYTGNKVYGSDGVTLYPELEYFNPGVIEDDGTAMAVIPMNMEYTYTNEFGEEEITNDPNKGIPTTTVSRFRLSLGEGNTESTKGTSSAHYLIPQIREYNSDANGVNNLGEYQPELLTTYQFSNVFEDYLKIVTPNNGMGIIGDMSSTYISDKKNLMLGTNNGGIPEDVFYKFIYGKVYTPSSFQGSHYEVSSVESFFGLSRRDAFLGIKQIRPSQEDDCTGNANYLPTNFAFRNRIKFSLLISSIVTFIQFIFAIILIKFFEFIGRFLFSIGQGLYDFYIPWPINWRPLVKLSEQFKSSAYSMQDRGTKVLPLTVYPDCEECSEDTSAFADLSTESEYAAIGEIKLKIVGVGQGNSTVMLIPIEFNVSTADNSSWLSEFFPNAQAREYTSATSSPLSSNTFSLTNSTKSTQKTILEFLSNAKVTPSEGDINDSRFIADVYPLVDDTVIPFTIPPDKTNAKSTSFSNFILNFNATNTSLTNKSFFRSGTFRYNWKGLKVLGIRLSADKDDSWEAYGATDGPTRLSSKIQQWTNVVGIWKNYMETISFSHEEWTNLCGVNYAGYEGGHNGIGNIIDRGTFAVMRIYDRTIKKKTTSDNTRTEIATEVGCQKYDKAYDESISYKYLWASAASSYGDSHSPVDPTSATNGYPVGLKESTSTVVGSTIMADIIANSSAERMPYLKNWSKIGVKYYDRKTKSGYSEIRDGVFTIIPVINGTSNNIPLLTEWYKRKRVGLFFCGGVTNFSFIDNWLNGLLYFFKFDYRIKWDDLNSLDLNQRGSKFPRELVFYNVLDKKFYYRATPYNNITGTTQNATGTTFNFVGQQYSGYKEILHPTTFYDVGVRDEFMYEICYDPRIDPTCSVVRDLTVTSYQDPANIIEHAINYRMDITNAKFDVGDFFSDSSYSFGQVLDGDITQLISINNEAGIEAFDLDSSKYFMFNGEFLDPEESPGKDYFTGGTGNYGPTPIDFKLDDNGRFVRLCLNNRLGDYSQKVPFFLWDKKGEDFGPFNTNSDKQRWDRTNIAVQPIQRLKSISGVTETNTNYLFPDGEEEYLLLPMTKAHKTYSYDGNYTDMMERFDRIETTSPVGSASGYTEGDLWLEVSPGDDLKSPSTGNIYIVSGQTWAGPISYVQNSKELFIFGTAKNYSGNKQVLSTGFQFYFGLKPGRTSFDRLIKYYGPKGAFPPAE
jgi:hypothetical protein